MALTHYDDLESRSAAARESALLAALPAQEVDLRSGAYAADGAAARAVGTVGSVGAAGAVGTVDAVPQQRQ